MAEAWRANPATEPPWKKLKALLDHAADLPVAADVQPEVEAIEQYRRLLDEPDSVPGLVDKLTRPSARP